MKTEDGNSHDLTLIDEHEGTEEWYCPTCGRRMTITWQPWQRIILEPGDVYAAHSGSKGGLQVGPSQIRQENADGPLSAKEPFAEDPYLAPWQRWLNKIDSEEWWNREV